MKDGDINPAMGIKIPAWRFHETDIDPVEVSSYTDIVIADLKARCNYILSRLQAGEKELQLTEDEKFACCVVAGCAIKLDQVPFNVDLDPTTNIKMVTQHPCGVCVIHGQIYVFENKGTHIEQSVFEPSGRQDKTRFTAS